MLRIIGQPVPLIQCSIARISEIVRGILNYNEMRRNGLKRTGRIIFPGSKPMTSRELRSACGTQGLWRRRSYLADKVKGGRKILTVTEI
jgi:hypothetical protein